MEVATSTDIQDTLATAKYFLADDHLYVVQVSKESGDQNDVIQNKFFDSFEITLGNRGRFQMEPDGELFTVEFPYKPKLSKRKPRQQDDGEIQTSLWIAGGTGYGFSVLKETYPNAFTVSDKTKLTDQTVESMESVFSLKAKNITPITRSLFDGSTFTLESEESMYLTNVFFVNNCLFTVSAMVPNDEEWVAQRFLDGFKIKSPLPHKHESKFGGFSIHFPAKPKQHKQKQDGIDEETLIHVQGAAFFKATSAKFPEEWVDKLDHGKVFEASRKGLAELFEGKVSASKQIDEGGYKVNEYRIDSQKKNVSFFCKDYIVGNRMIQLMVCGVTGKKDWRKDLFFRSLKIEGN